MYRQMLYSRLPKPVYPRWSRGCPLGAHRGADLPESAVGVSSDVVMLNDNLNRKSRKRRRFRLTVT